MKSHKRDVRIDFFNDENVRADLKGLAIHSGSISVISRALNTVILIGSVIVLARLLSPDDYGLVAMAAVFTGFFSNFQELGLADATIQAANIKHEQISTLFWINLLVGIIITIILFGLSPAVAMFYKKPQLTSIIMISSISFIFAGLTTQHIALLKRHLLFGRVMIIEILSNILSIIAAIILALMGGGYWAIVTRPLFAGFVTMILAWTLCSWRPGPPRRNTGVRPFLKIGANAIGFFLVEYFSTNVDKTIIGKKYGATDLGNYGRAFYLATTPAGQFTQSLFHVAVSTLSKLREDPEEYRRYYLKSLSVISFLGMPASVFMVVMSSELVYLLLGKQWNQAAGLFSILGLSAGMQIINWTQGWLHVSLGRTDRWLKWGILSALITVTGFLIGSNYGTKGVAVAYSAVILLLTFPGIAYAGRPIALKLREVLSAVWKYAGASIMAGILVHSINTSHILGPMIVLRIAISLFVYLLSYLMLVAALFRSIRPIADMALFFKNILRSLFFKKTPQ
ncbi:MAG: lipopolysaccharide biosynthesis protein [Planctomycetes bacterium]|nr:lipopolysaccharide biosynthesis protein [Planctomycetota bacterium]